MDKVYRKKEDEKQKLKMGGGSWSINLDRLPVGAEIIEYITTDSIYRIEIKTAFDKGFIVTLGGERKLVVPLAHWSKSHAF